MIADHEITYHRMKQGEDLLGLTLEAPMTSWFDNDSLRLADFILNEKSVASNLYVRRFSTAAG